MASDGPSNAPVPAALREMSSSPADRSGAVLVVEDDAGVREHSADILRELGYPVLEASDGAQALGILEAHPDIVLLFTDVGLPGGMNGRQLADEAQRRRPDLKVLYTTGYARNAIVHDGRLDPGVLLITKPFTYAELAASVDEALQPRRASLLLIEDEALIRLSTAADLGDFGFEVFEAATAAEARGVLARNGHRPTAIIVDLGLPDSAGDEIVVELRSGWPNLPVIVSSGANMDAMRPALAEDPLVRFLQKPYTLKMLVGALKELGIDPKAKGSA
jgi:CheY-like chemotaxis protein